MNLTEDHYKMARWAARRVANRFQIQHMIDDVQSVAMLKLCELYPQVADEPHKNQMAFLGTALLRGIKEHLIWKERTLNSTKPTAHLNPVVYSEKIPDVPVEPTWSVGNSIARHIQLYAMKHLPEKQREYFVKRYVEGKTMPEIAEEMGIHIQTVNKHHMVVIAKLQGAFAN